MIKGLYHIIFISFKKGTPNSIKKKIYCQYQTLGVETGGRKAGILYWNIQQNLDLRKNIQLIEFAVFKNEYALERFKNHPKYIKLVENYVKKYCNWYRGNFILK